MKLSAAALLIASVGSLLTVAASHVEEDSHPHRALRAGADQRGLKKKAKKNGKKVKKAKKPAKKRVASTKDKETQTHENPDDRISLGDGNSGMSGTASAANRRNQGNPNNNAASKCTGLERPRIEYPIPGKAYPGIIQFDHADVCDSSCECFVYDPATAAPVLGSGCCCTQWSILQYYTLPGYYEMFPVNQEPRGVCIDFKRGPKKDGEETVTKAIENCCKSLEYEDDNGGVGTGGNGGLGDDRRP